MKIWNIATYFSKILESSWVWTAAVIPNGTKIFFAKGTVTFINGLDNLLYNEPKNPPDWVFEIFEL